MNHPNFKKNLFKWVFIELFLVGGYWVTESFLPPLLQKVLPDPWKNLGWCALHAILQIWVFFKVLRPLINQRLSELYPDLSPRMKGITLFFTIVPIGAFLFLGFLYFAKPRAQGAPAPLLIRKGFAGIMILLIPLFPSLGFFAQNAHRDSDDLKKVFQFLTYWTSSPTGIYISELGRSVDQVSSVKTKISKSPDSFRDANTRLREYESIGIRNGTTVVLMMATEVMFVSKEKKRTQKNLEPNYDLNAAVNLLEGEVGILEVYRSTKSFALGLNPISLMNVGAFEFFLLNYINDLIMNKVNQRSQKALLHVLWGVKKSSKPLAELSERIKVLEGKIESLYPGAIHDPGPLEEPGALLDEDTAISR
jgi:hypothetical protein